MFFIFCLIVFSVRVEVADTSRCMYEKQFFVENSESVNLVDEDVLIIVNTYKLIREEKLKADCGDLRFVHEDVVLSYWIESNCNSSATKFWVRIDTAAKGSNETIKMRYNCHLLALEEENYEKEFLSVATVPCNYETSWRNFSDANGYFLKAATDDVPSPTPFNGLNLNHGHTFDGATYDTSSYDYEYCLYTTTQSYKRYPSHYEHYHEFDGSSDSVSSLPPHMEMNICHNKKLDEFFEGVLFIYDTTNFAPCHTMYSSLDNLLVRGGTSLSGEIDDHSHGVSGSINLHTTTQYQDNCQVYIGGMMASYTTHPNKDHSHSIDGSFAPETVYPPFISVIFSVKSNKCEDLPSPANNVRIIATGIPPLGYERDNRFDDRFLMGGDTFGIKSGSYYHNHTVEITVGDSSSTNDQIQHAGTNRQLNDYSPAHSHGSGPSIATETLETIPPYKEVVVLKRKEIKLIVHDIFEEENRCGCFFGNCTRTGNCSCFQGYYGQHCNEWDCHGVPSTLACSEHGSCISPNYCNCSEGYQILPNCSMWGCFGIRKDRNGIVCNGKGVCVSPDECKCFPGHTNANCSYFECFGYSPEEKEWACNGKGECIGPNLCNCSKDYYGKECVEFIKSGVYYQKNKVIECGYIVREQYLWEFPKDEKWNCDRVIANHEILGEVAKCKWNMQHDVITESLEISLGKNFTFKLFDYLQIVLRSEKEIVSIIVDKLFKNRAKNGDDDLYSFVIYFGVGFVSLFTYVLCYVFCFVTLISLYYRRKIKKRGQKEVSKFVFGSKKRDSKDLEMGKFKVIKDLMIIPMKDIKLIEIIGSGGSSATVFKAKWKNKLVAVKMFRTQTLGRNSDTDELFSNEISLLSSLHHPNIITFFGCSLYPPRVGFVFEFAENSDLRSYFYSCETYQLDFFTFFEKVRVMIEILDGVEYLHERKIIHRDLKSDNILLDEFLQIKITDFGIAKQMVTCAKNTKHVGTSMYMAR